MSEPGTVFRNARWYRDGAWAGQIDAVLVRDGRIRAVGEAAELIDAAGTAAAIVDLDGGFVLPGFADAHVHPAQAGMEMNRCDLSGSHSAAGYAAAIARYAADHPGEPWILGGGWSMDAFPRGTPTAAALDAVVSDRPIFLPNRDHHSAWVNTRALDLAGIDATTADPADGRIERGPDGTPTGALHEGAMSLVSRHVPATTPDDIRRGLLTAQKHLHALGITGWQDALVGEGLGLPDTLDAYCELTRSGALTARVVGALWWDRTRGEEQVGDLLERRERARRAGFRASSVKIMQDGVCETFTAAMLDPYRDEHGHETGNHGLDFIDPHLLRGYVARLDREGFQVHIHALGDRAVRDSLDALEHAREVNGTTDGRHHLAHLQVIEPADIERFRRLGATANVQMLWACNERQMLELTLPFLSESARRHQYLFGSLRRAGVRLAAGSDWPVSTPDPFAAIHVAVNRTPPPDDADGDEEPLLPEQALTVPEAIAAYTAGSAYVNHQDDAGAIEVGRLADFTVIDQDILSIEPARLAEIRATATIVGGRSVWRR